METKTIDTDFHMAVRMLLLNVREGALRMSVEGTTKGRIKELGYIRAQVDQIEQVAARKAGVAGFAAAAAAPAASNGSGDAEVPESTEVEL